MTVDVFDVIKIGDASEGGVRTASFQTCGLVCSTQIDVEVADGVIRRVFFTGGCHGNTQGVAALCAGMKVEDAITRLRRIDCKGRGTSCPDQLARALEQLT